MGAGVEPQGRRDGRVPGRIVVGIAAPLAIIGLAYGLWWISDRLLYVGPLDRAAFGWAVVVPVWITAPVAAGFAWCRLAARERFLAAVVVGATISGAAATLFWRAVAYPDCQYPIRTPGEWIVSSLIVGLSIGGGLVVSGLLASRLAQARRPWRAAGAAAGIEILMIFVAILVVGVGLAGPACGRPPA